jgi:hypothetical protein
MTVPPEKAVSIVDFSNCFIMAENMKLVNDVPDSPEISMKQPKHGIVIELQGLLPGPQTVSPWGSGGITARICGGPGL